MQKFENNVSIDHPDLFLLADKAGKEAVAKLKVTPMVVQQHTNPMDDNSPVKQQWFIEDGVCGFAWVNIKPANSKFANWMKKMGYGRTDSYYGGLSYWIGDYGQSMQKKEAYANAFAGVLQEYGIKAYASSRMD